MRTWLLGALLAVASCSAPQASAPLTPTSVNKAPIEATIDTSSTDCKAETIPGDCWLPLYPNPIFAGTPYNLRDSEDSPCQKKKQEKCWPQPASKNTPSDRVIVVCDIVMNGEVWFGVTVPPERILSLPEGAKKDVAQVGYAKAVFLKPEGDATKLDGCS